MGTGLNLIARDGHVYALRWTPVPPPDFKVRPTLVGIKGASTFTGFCKRHDAELFKAVEGTPFVPTHEQLVRLGYRGVCREVYYKRCAVGWVPNLREADRGTHPIFQRNHQALTNAIGAGEAAGLRDIEAEKCRYDDVLRTSDYDRCRYLVVLLERTPDLLLGGAYFPQYSFAGEELQDLSRYELPMDLTAVHLIATSNGGAFILSWLDPSPASERFARSLDALADDELPHAIVRFAFECSENNQISPTWWEALTPEQCERLVDRTTISFSLRYQTRPDHLMDDGLRLVSWPVTGRLRRY